MNGTAPHTTWRARVAMGLIVLAAWVLTFARTMDRDLNHDEHQFLAPAALVAREGLVPWRDFPLYHLPNLVYAYAAAERATGDLVLGAKLVNFAASAAVIAALGFLGLRLWPRHGLLIGMSLLLLLLSNPIYRYTAGKTWNHEVPTALLLGAGGCLLLALRRDRLWLTVAAGALGGLATGCRLTFAPTLVGLFCFTLFFPCPWRRRLVHAGVLTLAATAALSPSLYFLATEPERFLFSNFEFPRLRLMDPTNARIQKTVTLWRKVRFFLKEIVLPSWPIVLLWLAVAIRPGWQWLRTRQLGNPAAALWLLLFPFVLAGCFAPSRYQLQHFFVFVPLWAVATASGGRFSFQRVAAEKLTLVSIIVASVGAGLWSAADYAAVSLLTTPREWFAFRLARQAEEIREFIPQGPVLTLAPTLPLAGGFSIYPEFSTGTFGWRSAGLVPPERRQRLHLVATDDLEAFLRARPPSAILTGVEEDHEEDALIDWAQRHGHRPQSLKKKRTLWLPPARF